MAVAEKEDIRLRTRVEELKGQSSNELLEKKEAQNEVKQLRWQLQEQEGTIADQKKKILEMSK